MEGAEEQKNTKSCLDLGNDATSSLGLSVEKVGQCVGVSVEAVTPGWSKEEGEQVGVEVEEEEEEGKGCSTRARG